MGDRMIHVPTGKALLFLEVFEQGVGIFAVHLHLLEPWKFGAVIQLAETMNGLVGARSLLSELVAGEIENFETFAVVLFV